MAEGASLTPPGPRKVTRRDVAGSAAAPGATAEPATTMLGRGMRADEPQKRRHLGCLA